VVSGQCPSPEPVSGSALSLQAWLRPLQQALQLEADRGFGNLQGRREPFQAFLARELRLAPLPLPHHQQALLGQLADLFEGYQDQSQAQRQSLVRRTRQGLHELQKAHEPVRPPSPPRLRLLPDPAAPRVAEGVPSPAGRILPDTPL
jgi:ATP-dependent DNA helicase RecG